MRDGASECPANDAPEVLGQGEGGFGRGKFRREVVVGGVRWGIVAIGFLLCATGAAQAGSVKSPGGGEVSVEGADEFKDAPKKEEGSYWGCGGGLVAGELGREVGVSDESCDEANVGMWGDKSGGGIAGG